MARQTIGDCRIHFVLERLDLLEEARQEQEALERTRNTPQARAARRARRAAERREAQAAREAARDALARERAVTDLSPPTKPIRPFFRR